MSRTLFFADILGFSHLSAIPGAQHATDALSDVARLLSSDLSRFVQTGSPWQTRHGLSDSIFLVADAVEPAAKAIAEFFFNLAFYNSRIDSPVLMRGALVHGDVQTVAPIFPETSNANLVGQAVVQAVLLERCGQKGPRILLSDTAAAALEGTPTSWIVDRVAGAPSELLWLLPPDSSALSTMDGQMVGDVARSAADLLTRVASDPEALPHAVAYLDLVSRSLLRLNQHNSAIAKSAIHRLPLDTVHSLLQSIAAQERAPAHQLLKRWDQLKSA